MTDNNDAIRVHVPGTLVARYRLGRIVGWTFLPHGSDAGHFGPAATQLDHLDDSDSDLEDIDVDNADGPFWTAVRNSPFTPTWEE